MPCRIYKLDFQEKNLNLDRDLNQIPVQVQIFLLKISFGKYKI